MILVILIILAIVLAYIGGSPIPSYATADFEYEASHTPGMIARGAKLSSMLCSSCHMNRETGRLTGGPMKDVPPDWGTVYTPNITRDDIYGIGEWTDAELLYLLRTGIKKDGQYSPPYMAKLPKMADDDLDAIISFLRSDHISVQAQAVPDQPSDPSFMVKMLCRIAFKPFDMPDARIEMPDTSNRLEFGEYLAHNLECFSCHSADFATNNYLEPTLSKGYFAGGNKPLDPEGRIMLTSNLTPHKETGIGNWTRRQFINTLRLGIKEGEEGLRFPMMAYTMLTEHEAGSIYDYLMTIPAIENKVERSVY